MYQNAVSVFLCFTTCSSNVVPTVVGWTQPRKLVRDQEYSAAVAKRVRKDDCRRAPSRPVLYSESEYAGFILDGKLQYFVFFLAFEVEYRNGVIPLEESHWSHRTFPQVQHAAFIEVRLTPCSAGRSSYMLFVLTYGWCLYQTPLTTNIHENICHSQFGFMCWYMEIAGWIRVQKFTLNCGRESYWYSRHHESLSPFQRQQHTRRFAWQNQMSIRLFELEL